MTTRGAKLLALYLFQDGLALEEQMQLLILALLSLLFVGKALCLVQKPVTTVLMTESAAKQVV